MLLQKEYIILNWNLNAKLPQSWKNTHIDFENDYRNP